MLATTTREALDSKVKRWAAFMRNGDTGPLVIAHEVMGVVDSSRADATELERASYRQRMRAWQSERTELSEHECCGSKGHTNGIDEQD